MLGAVAEGGTKTPEAYARGHEKGKRHLGNRLARGKSGQPWEAGQCTTIRGETGEWKGGSRPPTGGVSRLLVPARGGDLRGQNAGTTHERQGQPRDKGDAPAGVLGDKVRSLRREKRMFCRRGNETNVLTPNPASNKIETKTVPRPGSGRERDNLKETPSKRNNSVQPI